MAYIPVGIIAARDENGNFLPARPIYIDAADKEVLPSGMTKRQAADYEDFTEYMRLRFWNYQRAVQKAQRQAEKEKQARQMLREQFLFEGDCTANL